MKTINCCGGRAKRIVQRTDENSCEHCGRYNGHEAWNLLLEDDNPDWDNGGIVIHGPLRLSGYPSHGKCGCPILAYWARWKGDDGGIEIPKDKLRYGWNFLSAGYFSLRELKFILPKDIYEQLC